jgi:O-antigen ligase
MREQRANLRSATAHPTGDRLAETMGGALLVVALAFGGGSRGAGDLVVHVVAALALALGLMRWRDVRATRTQRLFIYWLCAAALVLLLQLVPLPASVFAAMPQRASVLADLRQAGLAPAWLPMTLDIWGTVRALLGVMTLGAAWLLVTTLNAEARIRLLRVAVVLGVGMALVGLAQAAAGDHSRLRPFALHHSVGAIGSFANRNHFADLMAMLIPVALSFAFSQTRGRSAGSIIWYAVAVLLLLASALSLSRAGIVLTVMAAATAYFLMNRRDAGQDSGRFLPMLAAGAATAGVAVYAWSGIAQRLSQDLVDDLRWQYLRHGLEAARAYFPWGSGAGSFRDVYAPFEPIGVMQPVHALHAHNDLLEVALEAGAPGLLLVLSLLTLVLLAAWRVFRENSDARQTSAIITAAAIGVFVPLAHSFVDYPLRTLAVTTVFATLLAVLTAASIERVE